MLFWVFQNNGIYMYVEDVDPADPIRDIRVIMPGACQGTRDGKERGV